MKRRILVSILFALCACEGSIDALVEGEVENIDPRTLEAETGASRLTRLLDHQAENIVRDTFADLELSLPFHRLPVNSQAGLFANNDTPPERDLIEAYTRFAEEAAPIIAEAVACEDVECAEHFVRERGRGLFRRDLRDDEVVAFMALLVDDDGVSRSLQDGVRLQATALLMSPQFWYRPEAGDWSEVETPALVRLQGQEIATRLALVLWQEGPDDELLDAAAAGELDSADGRERHARRLLADPRADAMAREFFEGLFELKHFGEPARYTEGTEQAALYPGLSEVRDAMREETLAFTSYVLRSESSSFRELFLADYSIMSDELADYYGLAPGDGVGEGVSRVALDEHRRGVLTQGAVIGAHTTNEQYRAAHRGRFVVENLLCRELPAVELGDIPVPPPGLSLRQQFEAMTEGECQACHRMLNGIGFLFEHFDGGARYADEWDGFDVDASGAMPSGVEVDGVLELAGELADSEEAQRCFSERIFEFMFGRAAAASELPVIERAHSTFAASELSMRELVVAFVRSESFAERKLPE